MKEVWAPGLIRFVALLVTDCQFWILSVPAGGGKHCMVEAQI